MRCSFRCSLFFLLLADGLVAQPPEAEGKPVYMTVA